MGRGRRICCAPPAKGEVEQWLEEAEAQKSVQIREGAVGLSSNATALINFFYYIYQLVVGEWLAQYRMRP